MARNIVGKWVAAVIEAEGDSDRPYVGLLFTLTNDDLIHVHPTAGAAILFDVASELAQDLAIAFSDLPVTVHVKPLRNVGPGMVGAVTIEWSFVVIPPEDDKQMVKCFMGVAADFLEHIMKNPRHNTIISVDTEEEGERMSADPDNDRVISVKSALMAHKCDVREHRDECEGSDSNQKPGVPDPEVNAPPARGVN